MMALILQLALALMLGFLAYVAVVAHVNGKRYRSRVRERMYKIGSADYAKRRDGICP